MPGENIYDWSITAANNGNADALINWQEGQARASVNDSSRSMMAAHAKLRNLWNGSITTAGTANAQSFSSGYSFISTNIPTGLRALLKIGPGLTNTGAATLNIDGTGNLAVKDIRGNDLRSGELVADSYREFLYTPTAWILLTATENAAVQTAGLLRYTSATTLTFAPYNGDGIKIDGTVLRIPAAGVSISNTGVNIDLVAGGTLAANTTYLLCLVNLAGTLTPYFLTNVTAHGPSSTTGNVGTEIYATNDPLSVIGLIRTNASGQFVDSATQRFVRSWFNRAPRSLVGAAFTAVNTSYTVTFSGIGSLVEWVNWSHEVVDLNGAGFNDNSTDAMLNYFSLQRDGTIGGLGDGTSGGNSSYNTGRGAALFQAYSCHWVAEDFSEGKHSAMIAAFVGGGAASCYGQLHGRVG